MQSETTFRHPSNDVPRPADNPFAAQRIHPPIGFVLPSDTPNWLDHLRSDFSAAGWIGQIVGPHGSGKSTLAQEMVLGMPRAGRIVSEIIRPASRRNESSGPTCPEEVVRGGILPSTVAIQTDVLRASGSGERQVRLVDGMNRLGAIAAWGLARHCRQHGIGLLLTVHRPLPGIARLARLKPSLQHFRAIVQRLQQTAVKRVTDRQIEEAYRNHRGDYRAALFELYDVWYENHASVVNVG